MMYKFYNHLKNDKEALNFNIQISWNQLKREQPSKPPSNE